MVAVIAIVGHAIVLLYQIKGEHVHLSCRVKPYRLGVAPDVRLLVGGFGPTDSPDC